MFPTPKRTQYALRAIFELAKHHGQGPVKVSDIAEAQAIPLRFLEVILNQLKGSGLVASKRGFHGGYSLTRKADRVSVGELVRYMQGEGDPTHCAACVTSSSCPHDSSCAFAPMWNQVKAAAFQVYDQTTIQDLLNNEKQYQERLA